jgi:hypothetical protein
MLNVACSSNVVDIDAEDNVSFATFEASFPLSEQKNRRIKVRSSQVNGNYSQTVPNGKLIEIDDKQINGPTEVRGTTDLVYYSVSYGGNILFEDLLHDDQMSPKELYGIWSIGLAQTDMDFTLVHEGTRHKISDKTIELYGQVGLLYPITQSFSGAITLGFGIGKDLNSISEYDLRFSYQLAKKMGIIGGFRRLEYLYFVKDESDINVVFTGPFVGVSFSL